MMYTTLVYLDNMAAIRWTQAIERAYAADRDVFCKRCADDPGAHTCDLSLSKQVLKDPHYAARVCAFSWDAFVEEQEGRMRLEEWATWRYMRPAVNTSFIEILALVINLLREHSLMPCWSDCPVHE